MKRFLSHYLFLPGHGFLRQCVVEVSDSGCVMRLFEFREETESVIWVDGVLALTSVREKENHTFKAGKTKMVDYSVLHPKLTIIPEFFCGDVSGKALYLTMFSF